MARLVEAEKTSGPRAPTPGPLRGKLLIGLAALVCVLFATTLRDTRLGWLTAGLLAGQPLPASITDRDAALDVIVVNEGEAPLLGASVRVFALRDGKAYFAGDRDADATGRASFVGLPRGEAWVLAYGPGRSRASARSVLGEGVREERLVLRPARALDVVVVDESDKPVDGATVEVHADDPLPCAALTAASGVARVDRLGPPPYRVRASARGFEETVRTGVVPGPAPLRLRLERPAALEVTVVDEAGRPAAGALVLAAGSGLWPSRSAAADDHGAVRISGLRGGVYDLKARLGDRVSPTELAVPVKRGETKQVELRIAEGKRVTVTVTDGPGEDAPVVKDASVVLAEEGLSSFPLQGVTDARGVVTLGPVARERAVVSARAPGFVARSAVRVDPPATEARVPLQRGGVLVGEVVDDRGYPVRGATVEIVGVDAEGMPIDDTTTMNDFRDQNFALTLPGPAPLIPMGELGVMPGPIPEIPRGAAVLAGEARPSGDPWVTRADGTFRADPVTPGRVHALVRHPDYVEALSEAVVIRPGGEASVRVVLRQGGWIEGRVIEEDRAPVAGARVELAATKGSLERVAYTADDGTFTFAAVPDEVLLSVARRDAPADVVARATVQVPDRDRKVVEIVLPRSREEVTIHVADDRGYPLDRVEVRVSSLDLASPLRRTLFTSDGGDAELRDAAGLPLRVVLVRPGKAPRVEIVESAPTKLAFTLQEGLSVRGVVTARGGRDRLAGAEVTLFTASGARHLRTDAEGAFRADDLAPGRVRVSVSHPDHAPAELVRRIDGDKDHAADLGAIDLSPSGQVEGVVVDADDHPVAGARVARDAVPTYLPLGPLPRGIVATDRDGRFTLGGLPEGTVVLEAYAADLGRGAADGVTVRAGRTTSRVKLALPGGAAATREPPGAGSVAVTLGERGDGSTRTVVVVMVPPGSEAEAAGVEPGDVIASINGRAVGSIEAARRRLTGPLGEDVVLELRRDEGQGGPRGSLVRVQREQVRR
jgi:Carboxypeptidase regulatory-like domain/PDZ domain